MAVKIENTNEENFGTVTAGVDVRVSQYRLTLNQSGSGGVASARTGWLDLANERVYAAGDDIVLPAEDLSVSIDSDMLDDAFLRAMADDLLARRGAADTLMELGHGDVELAGRGYQQQIVELTATTV